MTQPGIGTEYAPANSLDVSEEKNTHGNVVFSKTNREEIEMPALQSLLLPTASSKSLSLNGITASVFCVSRHRALLNSLQRGDEASLDSLIHKDVVLYIDGADVKGGVYIV
jgi:hypothetical protein